VALAADLVTAHGLELPVLSHDLSSQIAATLPPAAATLNPVDLAGGGEQNFSNYERTVRALAVSGQIDAVLLTGYFGGYGQDTEDLAESEARVAQAMVDAATSSGRPLLVHTMYPASPTLEALRSAYVPVYPDIHSPVRVLARMVESMERPPAGVPSVPPPRAGPPIREGYFEARQLMASAGIPFIESRQVTALPDARAAAAELGYPVAVKALGSSHKSDVGGVRLGIANEDELEAAFRDIVSRLEPGALSVERMAPVSNGVELLVGVRRDVRFGPVLVIGLGGLHAELLHDVAVALAPVSERLAELLIRSLRAAPLLLGARGGAALDLGAAAGAAAVLSRLVAERPDIADAEINPLLVHCEGVLALDARIVMVEARKRGSGGPR